MNILVTGANGQLGSELKDCTSHSKNTYFFTDVADLDITSKLDIYTFVKKHGINVIVNCAAYTAVDKAEDDTELANSINNLASAFLSEVCADLHVFLIHISTDYVFDGSKNIPYTEEDPTSPLGVYGETKLSGEKAIEASGCSYLIFRTSWLYSVYGNNFVKTILRLTKDRSDLNVVFDQAGTPTNASDLANFIASVIEDSDLSDYEGIYHFSNEGVCSWFDFAKEIVAFSNLKCKIRPCHSTEFPAKVTRPNYSVLDKTKVKRDFKIEIPYWRESLHSVISKLI